MFSTVWSQFRHLFLAMAEAVCTFSRAMLLKPLTVAEVLLMCPCNQPTNDRWSVGQIVNATSITLPLAK